MSKMVNISENFENPEYTFCRTHKRNIKENVGLNYRQNINCHLSLTNYNAPFIAKSQTTSITF